MEGSVQGLQAASFTHSFVCLFSGPLKEKPCREEVMYQEVSFSKDLRGAESAATHHQGGCLQHVLPVWAAAYF